MSRVAYSDFLKIPKHCIWGLSTTFRAGAVVRAWWYYILEISGTFRLIQVCWSPPTVTYILGIGPSCPMWPKIFFKIPKHCHWRLSATFRAGTVVRAWWHYILDISGTSRHIQVRWSPPTVTYILGIGPSCPL